MKVLNQPVTILCSYVTLGTYIPALIFHQGLLRRGIASELVALEQLFLEGKLDEIPKLKHAAHSNFKFAKTALKMAPKNNSSSFDEQKVETLFNHWKARGQRHFVVFTGFWNEVINTYLAGVDHQNIAIDLVHMDADLSPSWKSYDAKYGNIRLIKLFDAVDKKLLSYIPPESNFSKPANGLNRVLIHGGGWGIGTYKEKISEMLQQEIKLNVIAYEMADVGTHNELIDYHLLDPQWKPANGTHYTFPSIQKVDDEGTTTQTWADTYYPYYNLVLTSSVIISKPGGGSINDSIAAGVPVVFLEPFGVHESQNAFLWKTLGYGIDYNEWKEQYFSFESIDQLRTNLIEGKKNLETIYQKYYELN
jgi:hypothetical protein